MMLITQILKEPLPEHQVKGSSTLIQLQWSLKSTINCMITSPQKTTLVGHIFKVHFTIYSLSSRMFKYKIVGPLLKVKQATPSYSKA